jgi:thioester reductase-like protein
MGATLFDQLVEEKIYPIFGDLIEENIGLSETDIAIISSQVDVIFHCAGNVDGNEHIQTSAKVKIIYNTRTMKFFY